MTERKKGGEGLSSAQQQAVNTAWGQHLEKLVKEKGVDALTASERAFLQQQEDKRIRPPLPGNFAETLWVEPISLTDSDRSALSALALEADGKVIKGDMQWAFRFLDAYWHGGIEFFRFESFGQDLASVPLKNRTFSVSGPITSVREKLWKQLEIRE